MAYTIQNFKTKKQLKTALAEGRCISVYQPGPFGPDVPADGIVYLEGPHYPEPHRWYAQGTMEDGRLVSVK